MESGAAEDRFGNGAQCPRVSVVLGDVIDIGESARRYAAAESISRLRESAAHKLARLIYTMLTRGSEYTDQVRALTRMHGK